MSKTQRRGQKRPTFALFAGPKRLKSSASLLDVLAVFENLPRLVQS